MRNENLKDGTELKAIYTEPEDGELRVGVYKVTRLVVSRVPGQMSMVPWVAVYEGEHLAAMYNCARLAGVEFAPAPRRLRRCPICGGTPGLDCDCWERRNEELDEHAQEGAEFGCSVPVAEEE